MTAPYDAKCAECRHGRTRGRVQPECSKFVRWHFPLRKTVPATQEATRRGPCGPDAKLYEPKTRVK
jgi:hypothetical protein